MTHEKLFKIGLCARKCVPIDFALMHCNFSLDTVTKYSRTKEGNTQHDGIVLRFSVPFIGTLATRSPQGYIYYNIESLGKVVDFLQTVTKKSTNVFPATLSKVKQAKTVDIISDVELSPTEGPHLCLVNFLNCLLRSNDKLEIRTYSDKTFVVRRNMLDNLKRIDADELLKLTDEQYNARSAVLEKFYEDTE